MRRALRHGAAAIVAAAGLSVGLGTPVIAHAQYPVCPVGMYWDLITEQCLFYDVTVYLDPDPIVGPLGPVGVGGVLGPVGPGPVGPGPVGPGPRGPGGPGRR